MPLSSLLLGLVLLALLALLVYTAAGRELPRWRGPHMSGRDASALGAGRAERHALAAGAIMRSALAPEQGPARAAAGEPTALQGARRRRALFDEARGHYMAALRGLRRRPPRAEAREPPAREPPRAAIIDAAAGFAYVGLAQLLANDALVAEHELVEHLLVEQLFAGLGGVDAELAGEASQRRAELVRERREAASAAGAGAPAAAAEAYVGLATQHTDDEQNTHDTGVLACLKAVVSRLRGDQPLAALPEPGRVAAEIRAQGAELSEGRAHRLADVEAVIARVARGERVVALGASDAECLGRVWLRASDPRNAEVADSLRRAVFDALYDCWEEGLGGRHIVCVNGRTARILGALALLDWDRRNWEVKKLEQFKNDVYARAAGVIAAEAARAAASGDPAAQSAGRLYLAKTPAEAAAAGPVPAAAAEALAERMRAAIAAMVVDYVREVEEGLGVQGAIPPYLVAAVTEEAQAAVA
jgi:hypothetical protein